MPAITTSPYQTRGRLIRWAASYDVLVQILTLGRSAQFRARITDLVQAQVGDVLLDVGCGTGDLALRLAKRVGTTGKVTGIDASPEMIARASQKARRRHIPVDFRLEPIEVLSFPDQTFDGVVSSLVFHHLPGDLKAQALQRIARVLKPGGQMTLVDFMNPTGQMLGHGGGTAAEKTRATLLQEMGFVQITSGPLGFRIPGMPPLEFVVARNPATQ